MFDIGWSELVLIGAVALVVIGPKELPGMLRTVGGAVTKIRRMAAEFQGQISEAMREAEMADVKKTVDGLNDSVSSGTSFNPIQTIRDEIRNAVEGTNPASTTTTAAEPTISIPPPPPVPDLTPEQIAAAFAPVEPVVEATEPAKKKRVRKAPAAPAALDTAGEGAAPSAATTTTAAVPDEAVAPAKPKRKTAKKATPVASDDEGTAG
jgi:sec-independent protein translocase protein TatB